MDSTIKEKVIKYKELTAQKTQLEAQLNECKANLEQTKGEIIALMNANGVQSVKYPEIGHVIISTKSHYEIFDKERFAIAMLKSLVSTLNDKKNIVDGFIAQFRPAKDTVNNYLELGHSLEDSGISQVDKQDLSLRKS